ncbi:NUDIX hydrolase [Alkalicoccus daliensis]|uniref:NUDIX domain-containing protein n=1 Tax=Alkalicoccus daliensis TaxID=745820 RepID=A0A1H0BHU8_9BACI|nr:CoA pyrophosphatase [Alkalicoccus daliensis]SDN45227.1 NUDIX domain-containing protein [Alkalicoccus daliensis]
MEIWSDNLHHYFKQREPKVLDEKLYQKYAIFIPVIAINEELHLAFEVRSSYVSQPGEICFPGGKVDQEDSSPSEAAVRELSEELGVSKTKVNLIGALDYMVTPSKAMIFPFIGEIEKGTSLQINEREVKEVFTISLKELLSLKPQTHKIHLSIQPEDDFPYHLIPNGEDYLWSGGIIKEQFYEYNNYIIWGLTARLLTHALDEIKKSLSAN